MLKVTLPNGKEIKRGDAILVQDGALVSTAFIDKIDESNGFPYVKAVILDTTRRTLESGASATNPVTKPGLPGYRHVSTPAHITGVRFCLIDEEEEKQLRAHHAAAATTTEPVVEQDAGSETVNNTSPLAPPTPEPQPTPALDPRDLNKDGTVTKAEKKQYNREQEGK